MYDVAEQVRDWLAAGREPTVATVVATRGFSSRDPGLTVAWVDGAPAVGRLPGAADPAADLGRAAAGLTELTVSETDAAAAGLACGGTATLLVQPASAFPAGTWDRLAAREPVCLLTTLDPAPDIRLFTPDTVREAGDAVARLFGRGATAAAVLDDPHAVALALWPVPTLVVVGDGLIAAALRDTGTLLGWPVRVTPAVADAVDAAGELHRCDAVVVLSHDRDVDGPALAAALAGRAGYVGGLGSRRTQAARREWLTDHGVPTADQDRVHGPAGLDIDAHTPAEIAISIVAEILAARAGSGGGALRERPGPVHAAGVQAPPPRY